jgi:hypothetical protein
MGIELKKMSRRMQPYIKPGRISLINAKLSTHPLYYRNISCCIIDSKNTLN